MRHQPLHRPVEHGEYRGDVVRPALPDLQAVACHARDTSRMRLFVAVIPPSAAIDELAAEVAQLRAALPERRG
ncbi:hypothetical protein GCM10020000_33110 [Streptomyces olivoverticillatus]